MPEESPPAPNDTTPEHPPETELPEPEKDELPKPKGSLVSRAKGWVKSHKKISIVIAIVLLALITVGVTDAKYALINSVASTSAEVTVKDSKTNQPVPDAEVSLGGKSAKTNDKGVASLNKVKFGPTDLKVKKFAYQEKSQKITVGLGKTSLQTTLVPTGTPVLFSVRNKISGQAIEGAKLSFGESGSISDSQGKATLSVPPQSAVKIKVKIEAENYLQAETEVEVKPDSSKEVQLTPIGKVYFLSKRTGKISVMKSNLDGSKVEMVLAGTGNEEEGGTILVASRDWKFLALKAKRDSSEPKLYLITTSDDKHIVMDEGDARFDLYGWSGSHFVYKVRRDNIDHRDPRNHAIKTYNASSNKLTTIDENFADQQLKQYGIPYYGWASQSLENVQILNDKIFYTRSWDFDQYDLGDKKAEIITVKPDGTNKQVIKAEHPGAWKRFETRVYGPDEVYIQTWPYINGIVRYYEYDDSGIKEINITGDDFNKPYPTYLYSPSGDKTFWSESRDGKNIFFVGDKSGENEKEIAALEEHAVYGWFSDDYLLVSKKGSELFIMPVAGTKDGRKLIKITDYHKPDYGLRYGYGYGGF